MCLKSHEDFGSLHPVVMAIPGSFAQLSGEQRDIKISVLAREALHHSAKLSGFKGMVFQKNEEGTPIPTNDVFWSISHAMDYVAAVIAPQPVGIDIERIESFSTLLKNRIAVDTEWDLVEKVTPQIFYSFWTAKEAVLKAECVGLQGLDDCRVVTLEDENRILLQYKSSWWKVIYRFFPVDHIISITDYGIPVVWHQLPSGQKE